MRLRNTLTLTAVAIALWAAPTSAFAWYNGPDGGDGFGTHDWVLHEALVIARPSWVDTHAALLATDDPDTLYGESDRPNHSYLNGGVYRGGPESVAFYYREALNAYLAGNHRLASEKLGVMSHYYADMCVPFHTRLGPQDLALHMLYESEVNARTFEPGMNREWLTVWSRADVDDVRARAIDAAMVSRSMYPDLETHLRVGGYNLTVEMMTRALLSRAVNDLADIIEGLPNAIGLPEPVRVSTTVSHRYPSVAGGATASARVVDGNGRPVEGVRVDFVWGYPDGPATTRTYSGPDGVARIPAEPSRLVLGRKVAVSARASQGQAGVTSAAASTWFIPTDEIGYMNTTLSDRYPSPHTGVTAETVVLNKSGQPIGGLPVTYRWRHRTQTITRTVATDARGIARHTRNIGAARRGFRVRVESSVPGGGVVRTDATSFLTCDNIATMESRVSSSYPLPKTKVTVSTRCLDADGRPIAGAKVTFTWRFRTAVYVDTAYTNAGGVASVRRDIGKATRDYPVYITSSAPSGPSVKASMTWFTPRRPVTAPSAPATATPQPNVPDTP